MKDEEAIKQKLCEDLNNLVQILIKLNLLAPTAKQNFPPYILYFLLLLTLSILGSGKQ